MGHLGEIEKVILPRIRDGVRNPEAFWGWLERKRNGMVALGRRLTDWGIYNHFIERILVKPHKSDDVTRRRRLAADFMGDMEEAAGGISMRD